mgnify:FL=1
MKMAAFSLSGARRCALSATAAGLFAVSAPAEAQDAGLPTDPSAAASSAGAAAPEEPAVRRVNASEVVEQVRARRTAQGQADADSESRGALLKGLLGRAAERWDDGAVRRGLERAADGLIDRAMGELEALAGGDEGGLTSLPSDEAASGEQPRRWRDRGRDMLDTALGELLDRRSGESFSEWMARVVRETVDVILDEYLAYFKEEGRAYAKELSDQFVERVREDEKISRALFSVQALCWCVIAYLTLVTLLMLYWARRSSRRQELLLRELRELRREVGQR